LTTIDEAIRELKSAWDNHLNEEAAFAEEVIKAFLPLEEKKKRESRSEDG